METLLFILTAALAFVKALASNDALILNTSLADGSNKIFVGEKTIFNVTVQFPGAFYDDVIIDVLPTIDLPDLFITNVKTVKVGANLKFSGNTKAVMDYGRPELQTPGKALSCQFHLGKVVRKSRMIRKSAIGRSIVKFDVYPKPTSEDDSVLIQYEALLPEEHSDGFGEVGHNHMYAVRVMTAKQTYFEYKHVMVAERSLPILFRALGAFPSRVGGVVNEMVMKTKDLPRKLWNY